MAPQCGVFLSCLNFAIINSAYNNICLKPKQVICLESLFLGKDVLAVLPTGYGKSLIFHLLPYLLTYKHKQQTNSKNKGTVSERKVIVVVSPLNALINDQVSKLVASGLKSSVLNVFWKTTVDGENHTAEINFDESCCNQEQLESAFYDVLFAHPESFISCNVGRRLFLSRIYQDCVSAIVVDEAHCILDWGSEFRPDYHKLGMLCAIFPHVPVLALTATANRMDREYIKESLGLNSCLEVTADPDRKNIFLEKHFREGPDIEAIEGILKPIALGLLTRKLSYPLTIIYLHLRWCGFAYRLFDYTLGTHQYFPVGCDAKPENRLFGQYHAPQTDRMKNEILKQLRLPTSKVRVVFATVAMGMGVDILSIRNIIHIGPPCTMREFFQEIGRAGRDGKPSKAILYYNNRDISKNRKNMQEEVREYCHSNSKCLRVILLKSLDAEQPQNLNPQHICCSVCKKSCQCIQCKDAELPAFEDFSLN